MLPAQYYVIGPFCFGRASTIESAYRKARAQLAYHEKGKGPDRFRIYAATMPASVTAYGSIEADTVAELGTVKDYRSL